MSRLTMNFSTDVVGSTPSQQEYSFCGLKPITLQMLLEAWLENREKAGGDSKEEKVKPAVN